MRASVKTLWILIGLAWAVTPTTPAKPQPPNSAEAAGPVEPDPRELACASRAARTASYRMEVEIRQVTETCDLRFEASVKRRIEAVRLEQRWHYRQEEWHETRMRSARDECDSQGADTHGGRTLLIQNGREVWMLHEVAEQRSAVRMRYGSELLPLADRDFFHTLRSDAELTAITEGELDGRPVWVIHLERKPDLDHGLGRAVRARRYIDKETGLQRLAIGEDANGETIYEARARLIEIEPGFAVNYFEFEPPAGTYVADLTRESEKSADSTAPPTLH